MELMCSFYNKNEHDWMGVFHASTISKNNHSVMFTGDSGNGKSTLVSILMANGYNVITDDTKPDKFIDKYGYGYGYGYGTT